MKIKFNSKHDLPSEQKIFNAVIIISSVFNNKEVKFPTCIFRITTFYVTAYFLVSILSEQKQFFSLHFNGNNSYLFIDERLIRKFKILDNILPSQPYSGNVLKYFTKNKFALNSNVYHFSICCGLFDVKNLGIWVFDVKT